MLCLQVPVKKRDGYASWASMKTRCYNKNSNSYKYYGAKGITVCDRWLHSFENFMADMGPKPGPSYSIDRIDGSGNYEPGNCRWATKLEQQNNTIFNNMIEFGGKVQSISQWARGIEITPASLRARLKHHPLEIALQKKLPAKTAFAER